MKVARSKISNKNLTTVPTVIRTALKLKAGDYIKWYIENEKVVIYKEAKK